MGAALAILTRAGLSVRRIADNGLFVAPADRLTDDLRQHIRSHKADILAELAANDSGKVAGLVVHVTPKKGPELDAPCYPDMRLSVMALHPCGTCYWRRTPGAARLGYCTGRDDLPLAYGLMHELPDDKGESCEHYRVKG